MDLDTGDTERVSPGTGKTTCAWIHPNGEKILFASTQDDPTAEQEQKDELELRASGKERRYSWDYDEFYEIYEYELASRTYHRLTDAKGYDAEGSWSPDGSLIAFASNRSAYERDLNEEEQQRPLKLDPAWANEIYVMKADGSDVKRLTTSPGYDGGPFFSADGKKICWRRFSENGATAEIMTMNIDGSDQQQLTHLQAMSWAPYFHPSGQYLIFTTNRHGFANFELYLVDAAGKHEPVRVTHTPGFDGLPVFSPDGAQLAWTTNRTTSSQSQIFSPNGITTKAMEQLGNPRFMRAASQQTDGKVAGDGTDILCTRRFCSGRCGGSCGVSVSLHSLAADLTGTKGEQLATNYVALHFETLGLLPAGDNDTYFQEFEFTSGVSAGSENM